MGFKRFLISIIKNAILLLVFTLIFSTVTFDLPNLIKNTFGDIFAYASPEAQKQVISKLTESCSALEQGQDLVTINQVCVNRSLFESMREDCLNYKNLKRKGIKIENEEQVRETCEQIESGELESACDKLKTKSSLLPDLSNIGTLCKDYNSGKINDKEFFFSIVSSPFANQQIQMPKIGVLEKYNQAISYLNNNKIIYFVILLILVILLFLLIKDITLFLMTLSGISLSIGIFIILPYFAILVYDKFIGINTTPVLSMLFGSAAGFDIKAVISIILLMFLRTYNSFIITLGITLLVIGIIGKVYGFISRRKLKKEIIVEKKPKDIVKEIKTTKQKTKKKRS